MNTNDGRRAIPSPPSGERVRVRGQRLADSGDVERPSGLTPHLNPLPSEGRGRGKHRTRTAAARDFARHLRRTSTDAEKRLWRLLRDRRFAEFKFRRQYPCGIYFLDFYCTSVKLAVELDGGEHGFPDQRAKDEKRNQFLAEQGIKVLRFWNHQVRGELVAVRFEIWHAVMERTGRTEVIDGYLPKPAPSPQPSPPMGARGSERQTCERPAHARDRSPLPLGGEDQGEGIGPLMNDATKKLPGKGLKRPWPPLIKMDAAVKAKVERLFGCGSLP